MPRATLDRARNFGTITGCVHGRAFEQDGRTFDQDGNELVVTDAMRLAVAVSEAEATAADSGNDKDAIIARLTTQLADAAAKLEDKATARARQAYADKAGMKGGRQ